MIADMIHFIWIGDAPLPQFARFCIRWFQELNPDFKVVLHGEEVLIDDYKAYYERAPDLCSKSDILRLSALKKYGGWYFDCDFVPLRPISSIRKRYPDIDGGIFLTQQSLDPQWDSKKRIANAVIAVSKDAEVWEFIDKALDDALDGPTERTMFGPLLMTRLTISNPELCTVSSKRSFYYWSLGHHKAGIHFFMELAAYGWSWDRICTQFRNANLVPIVYHLWAGGRMDDLIPREMIWKEKVSGKKKIVLVANPKERIGNYSSIIDSMDVVIRMNLALGCGAEHFSMGSKTTIWGCINAGRAATYQFLKPKPSFQPEGRIGKLIEQVWFSRPKNWVSKDGPDDSSFIIDAQSIPEHIKRRWPSDNEWEFLNSDLRKHCADYNSPSSGIVFLQLTLNTPEWDDFEIYTVGFQHMGWSGHPFEAEREFLNAQIQNGKVRRLEDFTRVIADREWETQCSVQN